MVEQKRRGKVGSWGKATTSPRRKQNQGLIFDPIVKISLNNIVILLFWIVKRERKEAEKIKAEEKYQEWLKNLKKKEQTEKEKRESEDKKQKLKAEEEKLRRKEAILKTRESQQELVKVRPISSRIGKAIVNGKLCKFYDWSTSPDPAFINKDPWQS